MRTSKFNVINKQTNKQSRLLPVGDLPVPVHLLAAASRVVALCAANGSVHAEAAARLAHLKYGRIDTRSHGKDVTLYTDIHTA